MESTNTFNSKNTCLTQLNLISTTTTGGSRLSSLFNLVDHTQTPMGKRLLKEKLLLPPIDPKVIQERYDYLEFFRQPVISMTDNLKCLKGHEQIYRCQQYAPDLKQMYDLERFASKNVFKFINPPNLTNLRRLINPFST